MSDPKHCLPDFVREGLATNQEKHGRLGATRYLNTNPAHGTMRVNLPKIDCPGCGRRPGKRHAPDCRTAPCPKCGKPRMGCGCRTTARQSVWPGQG